MPKNAGFCGALINNHFRSFPKQSEAGQLLAGYSTGIERGMTQAVPAFAADLKGKVMVNTLTVSAMEQAEWTKLRHDPFGRSTLLLTHYGKHSIFAQNRPCCPHGDIDVLRANHHWRCPFRYRGSRHESAVA